MKFFVNLGNITATFPKNLTTYSEMIRAMVKTEIQNMTCNFLRECTTGVIYSVGTGLCAVGFLGHNTSNQAMTETSNQRLSIL